MRDIRHVLFATSLCEPCCASAAFIQEFARRLGARLTIAHVFNPDVAYYSGFELNYRPVNEVVSDCAERSRIRFQQFLDRHCSGRDYDTMFLGGDPIDEIARACRTRRVDLLMLPRETSSRLRSLYHESMLGRFLAATHCALWTTCRPAAQYRPGASVLCGIDFHGGGGPDAEQLEIAETGRWLADKLHAPLALAHVADSGEMHDGALRPGLRELWREFGDRVHADDRQCLGSGRIPRTLCGFARDIGAAVLIVGRSHSASLFGDTRPRSLGIVREAPCPVLCAAEVKAPPATDPQQSEVVLHRE